MPSKPNKKSKPKGKTAIERITELVKKSNTIISFDVDEDSTLVKLDACYSYSEKTKILVIHIDQLAKINKTFLHGIIRSAFDQGGLIWKASKQDLLKSFKAYQDSMSQADKATLEFFKGVIPNADFLALKMALFLRSQDRAGRSITVLRQDIRDRFGDRGNNISNLCSAGYFDSEFRALQTSVPADVFKGYYEIAVGEQARALFVNTHMNQDELLERFNEMVVKANRYHMFEFRIHGKGTHNIQTIQEFVESKSAVTQDEYIIRKAYDNPSIPAIEFIVVLTKFLKLS